MNKVVVFSLGGGGKGEDEGGGMMEDEGGGKVGGG